MRWYRKLSSIAGGSAKVLLGHAGPMTMQSTYGTRYAALNSYYLAGTESWTQTPIVAGTFTRMSFHCSANTLDGPLVLTLRLAGAATLLTYTLPAGTTGTFSITQNVAVALDQLVNLQLVETATTGSAQVKVAWEFEPS